MDVLNMNSFNHIKKGFFSSFSMITNSVYPKRYKNPNADQIALLKDIIEIGNDMKFVIKIEGRNLEGKNVKQRK